MTEGTRLLEQLVELEHRFWDGGADVYERYLDDEALMVFPAPVGVLVRDETIASISAAQRWTDASFDDVRLLTVTDDVVVLTYRAAARREEDTTEYRAVASSVYVRRADGWRLAVHQQSPPAT